MPMSRLTWEAWGVIVAVLAMGLWNRVPAQPTGVFGQPDAALAQPGALASGTIANNDSIFIDGKNFTVTPGRAKADASPQIRTLGARDLGPGAIVFRSGGKLY